MLDSVPQLAPLHPGPDTLQLTPLFCASFCTTAVKFCDCIGCTAVLAGVTAMLIGATRLIVEADDCAVSNSEVAVS